MNFLHFWALGIGAVAIAAPVAVHFLTKPKPVRFGLSTVRFLREAIEQRKARSRFRDWLILLLRTLCVALLAMALARPLFQERQAVPTSGEANAQRVLVIDQSQSMTAGSGGLTNWSSAVVSATQYLESAQGLRAAVVFAGAKPRAVFNELSPNLAALREAVMQAKPLAERCDPRAALEVAAQILEKVKSDKKELVILSDFQRSNWGTLLLDLVPRDTQIQFHSVSIPDSGNVAVQGGLATRVSANGMSDQILAELSDTSALMYLSSVGSGQMAVLNADLMRSNWPVQPTFLPVLSELSKSLLAQRGQGDQAFSGEPVVRVLPASLTSESTLQARTVEGTPPNDGDFGKWQWSPGQGAMVWSWQEPPGPGIYALDESAKSAWMIATSAPAIESDLSSLDKEVLTERLSGGRDVGFASAETNEQGSDDLWSWLIAACLLGLIGEIAALRWNRM